MPRRGNANIGSMGSFSGSIGKKSNMNNRNRPNTVKRNYGGSNLGHQVNPWLSQCNNSSSPMSSLGRNIASDQQAQLALASSLLNNLLGPASQLNKVQSPPSLLSLGRTTPNSSLSFGGSSGFNRDRFSYGRQSLGKVYKEYRKGDFKNKRFGDRKNNKKSYQAIKQATDVKNAEKKDVVKKEEIKVGITDVDQSWSNVETEVSKSETEVLKTEPTEKAAKKNEEKSTTDEPKMCYNDVPAALLFCHICRKHMWDDSSFEKHLEGRPHKLMVEELDHSYKLKVDLLRHEMRVAEQQRENDIQRAQRKGKSNVKMQQREFCTMCNLSFLGMLPAHRKNERHQRLKKFLHPKCNICLKEFYTRLEWDDHKLTPTHLKRLAEIRKEIRPDLENTEFDIIDFIEDINDEYDTDNIELKVVGKRESLNELQGEKCEGVESTTEENQKDETNEEKGEEEEEEAKKLPKYNAGIPVGENFVVEKIGFLCRACAKFILSSEDIKIHCQTVVHYNNIIKILKAQNKIVRKRRLNDTKNEDKEDSVSGKNVDKRQKVCDQLTEINGVVESKIVSEGEKYDPENPESENEKDQELTDSKILNSTTEPKVIINDICIDAKNDSEVKTEVVVPEPPKEVKKGRASAVRGPRARRGRRQ